MNIRWSGWRENRDLEHTALCGVPAAAVRLSAAEKRFRRALGCALGFQLGLQPGDLVAQQGDPFGKFGGGKQGEVLADLVPARRLFRFVVEDRHRRISNLPDRPTDYIRGGRRCNRRDVLSLEGAENGQWRQDTGEDDGGGDFAARRTDGAEAGKTRRAG